MRDFHAKESDWQVHETDCMCSGTFAGLVADTCRDVIASVVLACNTLWRLDHPGLP
jgi:hypothetical protein